MTWGAFSLGMVLKRTSVSSVSYLILVLEAWISDVPYFYLEIDLFVPADRVLDTVDIYYIESRHRRLSLRFLSWIVLKQNIQSGEHDSIEDARCALLLFRAFQEYEEKGIWDEKLEELYKEGKQYVRIFHFYIFKSFYSSEMLQ